MILHPREERVSLYPAKRQAPVAQWIEHLITVQKVGGSSPSGRAAAPLGAIHRWGFCISAKHSFGSAFSCPSACGGLWRARQIGFLFDPRRRSPGSGAYLTGGATELARHDSIRAAPRQSSPCTPLQHPTREKLRPARPLHRLFREKVRPASVKRPILGCFERAGRTFSRSHPPSGHAGRTFSRTGHNDMAALKPMTPLRPLLQTNVKPPSPMLAPKQRPLKPATPLQPKNAPKTPISYLQRRWWFHLRLGMREQRGCRFQTTAHLACGLQLRHQQVSNSHVIRLGEVSIKSENVVIPTI